MIKVASSQFASLKNNFDGNINKAIMENFINAKSSSEVILLITERNRVLRESNVTIITAVATASL